eukprot:CAMPEP_0197067542 /NCGR_PEP_ID=MMETSP1384-20130603/180865_1 /TAXON_ID=29189 /ORGANISM="Ammonia sp." /LENGTH=66 /DNA_ID=CAMNT_0042505029 /DNA_START=44 /DNA_END=241 /DNA_ORIENTATION=-
MSETANGAQQSSAKHHVCRGILFVLDVQECDEWKAAQRASAGADEQMTAVQIEFGEAAVHCVCMAA